MSRILQDLDGKFSREVRVCAAKGLRKATSAQAVLNPVLPWAQ